MLYAMLIYEAEGSEDHFTGEEKAALVEGHVALRTDTKASGIYRGSLRLTEGYPASTVRKRGSRVTVEDGPYAETKELLIGLYLLECADLDTAVKFAQRIPNVEFGAIEIRPVMYFEDRSGPIVL